MWGGGGGESEQGGISGGRGRVGRGRERRGWRHIPEGAVAAEAYTAHAPFASSRHSLVVQPTLVLALRSVLVLSTAL